MPTEPARPLRRTLIPASRWWTYVALFQAIGWASMVVSGRDWMGSWKMAYDWVAGSLILVGPMAAGVAAVTYARIRRSSAFDLIRAGDRAYGWVFPLLRLWLAVLGSTALLGVEVTVLLALRGVPAFPAQLSNLPYLLALALAYVALGALLGLHLSEVWAGSGAVVASFLAFLLAATGILPRVLMPGGITGSLVGEGYRPHAMLLLFGSAAALAIALLAVLHAHFGGSRRVAAGVTGAGLATLLLVGSRPGLDLEGRLRATDVDYVCRGYQPALCMARETPLLLEKGAASLYSLSRPLVEIGVALPDRWLQDVRSGRPDAGEFLVTDGAESTGRLRVSDVLTSLAYPAACPHEELEPLRSQEARYRLSGWIGVRNGLNGADSGRPSTDFEDWARSADSEPWVRTTYRLLRQCRLHVITRPTWPR